MQLKFYLYYEALINLTKLCICCDEKTRKRVVYLMSIKFVFIFFLALFFIMFFSLDYNFRKDDVMPAIASFLDDPTLDFANARSVTLAPGLRPELRSHRWLGDYPIFCVENESESRSILQLRVIIRCLRFMWEI